MRQGMRKFLAEYKKVVFRAYRDEDFREVVGRGELEIHLGIMGPFIRTEINDVLTVSDSERMDGWMDEQTLTSLCLFQGDL